MLHLNLSVETQPRTTKSEYYISYHGYHVQLSGAVALQRLGRVTYHVVTQCWLNVGPPSTILVQHQVRTGSTSCVVGQSLLFCAMFVYRGDVEIDK